MFKGKKCGVTGHEHTVPQGTPDMYLFCPSRRFVPYIFKVMFFFDCSAMKPATVAAVANIIMALPASADAGKLFDFNLTLPVMAAEFLLLMVFLDKTWFTPVGDLLDKRDAELRGMVGEVKDNSANLAALKAEADGILRSARADAQAQLQACKSECQADMDSKFGAAKAKVDKELQVALEALAKEEAEALKSMQGQVDSLSNEIIARVLPEGVSL